MSKQLSQGSSINKSRIISGRRPFLKGSGLAIFGGLMTGGANAQSIDINNTLTEEEQANIRVVNAFCAAWATMDLQNVVAEMTATSIYRMSADTPAVDGHQGLIDQMQPWVDSSSAIEFKVLETYARGPMVINHRIDTFSSQTRPVKWQGVGIFLMENGKIREWSDYTMSVEN